jgi:hypothetical protein
LPSKLGAPEKRSAIGDDGAAALATAVGADEPLAAAVAVGAALALVLEAALAVAGAALVAASGFALSHARREREKRVAITAVLGLMALSLRC